MFTALYIFFLSVTCNWCVWLMLRDPMKTAVRGMAVPLVSLPPLTDDWIGLV